MESIVLKKVDSTRRLLVAFAHPDDESFGPAGTIIHYASSGVAVHYACATRGEAGDVNAELRGGYSSVADLRTAELLCAAHYLGLAGLYFLGYTDSGMENAPENQNPDSLIQAPLEEVAEKITRLVRVIQPQVILTHDPTGGYFHPDHIKVHQAATRAFHAAGKPDAFPHQLENGLQPYQPQKLYYNAFPRRMMRLFVRVLPLLGQDPEAFGRNKDINIKRIADVDQKVTTQIGTKPYLEERQQAARCHASQMGGSGNRLTGLFQKWLGRSDSFFRAVPPFEDRRLERDLFTGVETASR
jgi:LmbE family N-acetylglucosaminyl deacetylase